MTDHERALLLFVAERLHELMETQAEQTAPVPHYGWDGREPPAEWREVRDLSLLIDVVKDPNQTFIWSQPDLDRIMRRYQRDGATDDTDR